MVWVTAVCPDCQKVLAKTEQETAARHPALHQEVMQMFELEARLVAYTALYFKTGYFPCWGRATDELPAI
jgi:hypothetical protein